MGHVSKLSIAADMLRRELHLDVAVDENRNLLIAKDPAVDRTKEAKDGRKAEQGDAS